MRQFRVAAQAEDHFNVALDYYLESAGAAVALRFIEAWDHLAELLKEQPFAGSKRVEVTFGIEGLRSIPLSRFPYIVFYTVNDDMLRIIALIHSSRDLANNLRP